MSVSKWLFSSVALSLLLAGCGSSSDDNSPPPPPEPEVLQGVFVDSAVVGLSYETATQSGVTNNNGQFNYIAGESVTFSLGGTDLPPVNGGEQITPLDLFDTDDPSTTEVLNLLRTLQSLDDDGDPDNNIVLDDEALAALENVELDLSDENYQEQIEQVLVDAGIDDITLISEEQALAHFEEQINPGYQLSDMNGDWLAIEWFSPKYGYNDPNLFDYYLADMTIEDGQLTETYKSLSGNTEPSESTTIVMNDDGMIGGVDEEPSRQLSSDNQLLLGWTEEEESQFLAVAVKRADNYQLADLQGDWWVGSVYTPSHGNGDPEQFEWNLGSLEINDSGVVTYRDLVGTDNQEVDTFEMGLTDDGRLTEEEDMDNAYFQLSRHKDVLVQLAIWDEAQMEWMVGVRQPEQLELAKMKGRWYSVTMDFPYKTNDGDLYNYSLDYAVFDDKGLSQWTQIATDDPEADLEVVDSMQLSISESLLRDEYGGYWLVNASYTVAINIYDPNQDDNDDPKVMEFAVLVRVE